VTIIDNSNITDNKTINWYKTSKLTTKYVNRVPGTIETYIIYRIHRIFIYVYCISMN
jgi:hypothetical protein